MMYDLSLVHWGCQESKDFLWGGRFYWGHQLRQDLSEWQCWLVAAGKALRPTQARDKPLMGMFESAAENEAHIRTGQVGGSGEKRAEINSFTETAGFRLQQVQ